MASQISFFESARLCIFALNPGDIMVMFTAPEDRIIRSVTHSVTEKVTDKVTDKESEVLTILANDPGLTSEMIAVRLGVSRKAVSARLSALKRKGIISRVGSDRKGYWQINSEKT